MAAVDPSVLLHVIDATCGKCGGAGRIYPDPIPTGTLFCPVCSPAWLRAFLESYLCGRRGAHAFVDERCACGVWQDDCDDEEDTTPETPNSRAEALIEDGGPSAFTMGDIDDDE